MAMNPTLPPDKQATQLSQDTLAAYREQIDEIDLAILKLIEKRLEIAEIIAICKEESAAPQPLTDSAREAQILARLEAATTHPLLRASIQPLFGVLLEMSKRIRLAYRNQKAASPPHPDDP
jgi:chorismate mutase